MTATPDITTRMVGPIEFAERAGGGLTCVLLHGIGSNASSFLPLMAELPADWRILAWNAPGYGRSEPLAGDWPLARDYAEALAAMLDELAIRRVTLLGHSLGALVAASFAAARRDRVDHLVLASPALGHGIPRGNVLSASAQARIDDLEIEGPDEFAARRAARLVFEPDENPTHVEAVRRAMSKVRLPGYAQAARMLSAGRLLDDMAQLTVPTDVIVGADDRITPSDGARCAHEALRAPWRGRFVEVPQAGHAIAQERPAVLARLLVAEPEPVR